MVIEKIINNNVVFSKDKSGKEIVVAGKGIAFQKKIGMEIETDRIEKIFHTKDYADSKNIDKLLEEIPVEIFEITNDVIEYGKVLLNKDVSDSLLLSLSDHIHTVLKRMKDGMTIINPNIWEIKRYYPDEYLVGKKALELIEEKTEISLPEDEVGFIAVYFVNATMYDKPDEIYSVMTLIQEISTIIKYHFKKDFDEESIYYYRFITHLKFFSQRLFENKQADSQNQGDLFEILKDKYINSYECVTLIDKLLQDKYQYALSKDEMLYLIIHIERLIYTSDV